MMATRPVGAGKRCAEWRHPPPPERRRHRRRRRRSRARGRL